MRKLLALLIFVPSLCFSDTPSQQQNGRYAISNGMVLDTRTGSVWKSSNVEGMGGIEVFIPVNYIQTEKSDSPSRKTFTIPVRDKELILSDTPK